MTSLRFFAPLAVAIAAADLTGQQVRTFTSTARDDDRPRIGVTTGPGGKRDTLGLLVTDVTRGGPAEKAGIEEGDRLVSVNGVNLRLSAQDLEDLELTGLGTRRLVREIGKVKAGDKVNLKVYREGQVRDVAVTTVTAEELEQDRPALSLARRASDDRATLGIGLGMSGSRRDTLGILVAAVTDDGPADKARIEEGDRIAAINGVDLRVPSADAGDWSMSNSRMRRLNREMEKLKAGDEVELRLMRSGQSRTVRVKTVAQKDLPRSSSISIGGDGFSFFGDGQNGFSITMPRGGMPLLPKLDGQGMMFFDRGDGGEVRMRLSPERQAELDGRIEELRRRFDGGRVIVRPKSRIQSDSEADAELKPKVEMRYKTKSGTAM
ncbi:MAG: PDZ domain-containing protein [Gemmatimonadetes bacterium]|nr:PDZ domain-containing protein [Gemmatimonadota bacterium]